MTKESTQRQYSMTTMLMSYVSAAWCGISLLFISAFN